MIRTYTPTLFHHDLTKATFELYLTESCKYHRVSGEQEKKAEYTGVTAWDIIEGGQEADEIESQGLVDEYHEYLVLHFKNGVTATFRNSHVDMFIR